MCKDFKDDKKKEERLKKRLEKMCEEFKDAKKKYNDFRNKESLAIVHALRADEFEAKGYHGTWRYTSRRRINPPHPPHDLGMWKWIVARKDGITVFIKLQTLEQDKITKNIHVLLDRISIDVFWDPEKDILSEKNHKYSDSIKERYGVENEFDFEFMKETITDFSLPLKKGELEKLVEFVEKKVVATRFLGAMRILASKLACETHRCKH